MSNPSLRVRALIVALAAVGLFAGLGAISAASRPSAAATKTKVHLRIETAGKTLFNGDIATGARSLVAGPNPDAFCGANNTTPVTATGPSPLTALGDAAEQEGFTYATSGDRYDFDPATPGPDVSLCDVGAYRSNDAAGSFWSVKINNDDSYPAVTSSTALKRGDTVLWYFNTGHTGTLDLRLPKRAAVGRPIRGKVIGFANGGAIGAPVAGATVKGAGASATTNAGGVAKFKITRPGTFVIGATADKMMRGSDVICIYRPGSGKCGTRKRRK